MNLRRVETVCIVLAVLSMTACGGGGDGGSAVEGGPGFAVGAGGGTSGNSPAGLGGGGSNQGNQSPVVALDASPRTGLAALTVYLDASGSRDPDGTITKYSWNFGDASANGSGAEVTHVFENPGEYTVSLTVTDNDGARSSTSTKITVLETVNRFAVTFLPFPGPDYQFMHPFGLNDFGHVVGEVDVLGTSGTSVRGFYYANGVTQQLGTLGGLDSGARAINNAGAIVGYSINSSGRMRATGFTGEIVVDLGASAGDGAAFNINDAGKVVGVALDEDGFERAVVFDHSAVTYLGTFGGSFSGAYALNEDTIVGYAATADERVHAFAFENSQMVDLGTLGGDESIAIDISRSGQILGVSEANYASGEPGYPFWVGFVYRDGVVTEIRPSDGRDVFPAAINDHGQVVGVLAETDDLDDYPFLWQEATGIRNLNDLIDPAIGCRLVTADDINASGQVVGLAVCDDGKYPWDDSFVGVLLTPES